jgi:serine/threonine protein kinase/tetratricopeptide (TPR) repeat protein
VSTISRDRWNEVSPFLDEVLSIPEAERGAWVADFERERPELGQLLNELLEEHGRLKDEAFLSGGPPVGTGAFMPGEEAGAYRLISLIGEGGMGTVWLAERSDGRFERKVAVKFLRFSFGSQSGTGRFKREGRILAQMAHPHIAELIDAGVSAMGQPYIVLEHIEGQPIDVWCDNKRLDVSARITLFLDVLSAVAHAHANLVVHRDIKPSNVMVRNDGCVKLLDFGIAKLIGDDSETSGATQLTMEGGSALTPHYAAPEQITGGAITTATDVYALGALLYLLLAGKHPTNSEALSPAELVKAIAETEPIRLSDASASGASTGLAESRSSTTEKLRRELRGDLETIVGKSLKKNPSERYVTASAFAEDLRRFLKHEPISARPDGVIYRARKFLQRNRTAVALGCLALLGTLAGVTGTLLQARTARKQRDFAFRQLARAEASNELISFVLSDAAPSGKPFKVNDLLDRAERIVKQQSASDETTRVELLDAIGEQYSTQDETAKSVQVLEEAYRLSRNVPDPSVRASTACDLANSLARSGENGERPEKLFQEGMRAMPAGPEYASVRADCLLRGSEVAQGSGDVKSGIARVLEAQRVSQASIFHNKVLELTIAIDTASAYRVAGQNREAVAAFQRAAETLKALGRENTQNAAVLFNNWAYALNSLGRPREAEKLYQRAMSISRDSDNDEAVSPMVLLNYAKTLRTLGRLQEASVYAEQASTRAKVKGFALALNQALLERARIYRDQESIDQSDAMLKEVEPRLRQDLPPSHYAFAVLEIEKAQNEFHRGNLKGALRLANEAVGIDEKSIAAGGQGSDALPSLLVNRAGIEMKTGNGDKAVADASRAVRLLQEQAEPGTFSTQLARSYMALGNALRAQGKQDEARVAFRSAAEHFENALGPDHPDTRSAIQSGGLETK